jgi:hypothetical protein
VAGKKKKKANKQGTGHSGTQPLARTYSFKGNRNTRSRQCRIAGHEIVGILTNSVLTSITQYLVSVTNETLFPLLSRDGIRFSEATCTGLTFHLHTTSATNRNGRMGIAWQPNADYTATPESFQAMENFQFVTIGPCYESLSLTIPVSALLRKKVLIQQTTADAPTQISSLIGFGRVYFFTSGGDGEVCAEIGVEYDMKFEGQFFPNNIEITRRVRATGTPTSNSFLLDGVSLDTENTYSEVVTGNRDFSGVPHTIAYPAAETEGITRAIITGTGFDATTDLTCVAGTSDLIAIGAQAVNYLKSTTSIVSEYTYAAIASAAQQVATLLTPLDWFQWAISGTIGTITNRVIEFYPLIVSDVFKSLPLLLAFKEHPYGPQLQDHWARLRLKRMKPSADPILAPVFASHLAKLRGEYFPFDAVKHVDTVVMTLDSVPNQVKALFLPKMQAAARQLTTVSPVPQALVQPVPQPVTSDDDGKNLLPSSLELSKAVGAYIGTAETFGVASPKAYQAVLALDAVAQRVRKMVSDHQNIVTRLRSLGEQAEKEPRPCDICENPLCPCSDCHKCLRE